MISWDKVKDVRKQKVCSRAYLFIDLLVPDRSLLYDFPKCLQTAEKKIPSDFRKIVHAIPSHPFKIVPH